MGSKSLSQQRSAERDFRRMNVGPEQWQVNTSPLFTEEETFVKTNKCRTQVPYSFFSPWMVLDQCLREVTHGEGGEACALLN